MSVVKTEIYYFLQKDINRFYSLSLTLLKKLIMIICELWSLWEDYVSSYREMVQRSMHQVGLGAGSGLKPENNWEETLITIIIN